MTHPNPPATATAPLAVGDFIDIPAWAATGCVMSLQPATQGSEDAIEIRLQESPDAPPDAWRRYRLEPHEYRIV